MGWFTGEAAHQASGIKIPQEQAFQMTDWHITAIIRGRHETNITSRYLSPGCDVEDDSSHSLACMYLYHYGVAMVALSISLSHTLN